MRRGRRILEELDRDIREHIERETQDNIERGMTPEEARKAAGINGYMSSGDCPSNLRFGAANPSGCSFSEPMFREIRNTNQFSGVAAFANAGPLALTGNGPASMISGQLVSGDFFNTLG